MGNESKLIKDWKGKDVQRMRNIITKDYSAKTNTQIGYTKAQTEYKEGDVWEEKGKQWTIKNGIKITVTKLDIVRKALHIPLICPACHQPMNRGRLDKVMYSIHKQCSDCVIKHETELKRQGKFEEYQQNINKQSIAYHIKEMENIMLELALNQSDESFVTEAGDIESWKGKDTNSEKLIQDIQEYVKKLKDMIVS